MRRIFSPLPEPAEIVAIDYWDMKTLRTAEKRVSAMPVTSMLDWADAAGSGMARAFQDYRKHQDTASLDEIRAGLICLWAVASELTLRAEAERDQG